MMDIQKLKHLASEADRQVTWSLVPFDLHKDEWETDVVNYIGAISPATITDLLNRLEKAEAQIAELAKQEPVAWVETSRQGFEAGEKIINSTAVASKMPMSLLRKN